MCEKRRLTSTTEQRMADKRQPRNFLAPGIPQLSQSGLYRRPPRQSDALSILLASSVIIHKKALGRNSNVNERRIYIWLINRFGFTDKIILYYCSDPSALAWGWSAWTPVLHVELRLRRPPPRPASWPSCCRQPLKMLVTRLATSCTFLQHREPRLVTSPHSYRQLGRLVNTRWWQSGAVFYPVSLGHTGLSGLSDLVYPLRKIWPLFYTINLDVTHGVMERVG